MGITGSSPLSLILILLIAVTVFGTKRLKNIGSDIGEAVRNFRKGLEGEKESKDNLDESTEIKEKDKKIRQDQDV